MEKVGDTGDISLLFFLAGANFWAIWAILGHFWAILSHFGSFLGHFLVLIFFGQKCISAILITFCISGGGWWCRARKFDWSFGCHQDMTLHQENIITNVLIITRYGYANPVVNTRRHLAAGRGATQIQIRKYTNTNTGCYKKTCRNWEGSNTDRELEGSKWKLILVRKQLG